MKAAKVAVMISANARSTRLTYMGYLPRESEVLWHFQARSLRCTGQRPKSPKIKQRCWVRCPVTSAGHGGEITERGMSTTLASATQQVFSRISTWSNGCVPDKSRYNTDRCCLSLSPRTESHPL